MPDQTTEVITAEYERQTSKMQTTFDKLLFITSLQDWLGTKHRELFNEWLSCSLEEQYEMLAPYYRAAAESGMLSPSSLTLSAFSRLIPAGGIEEGPRVLFYSNLDLTLEILSEELCVQRTKLTQPPQVVCCELPPFF